MFKKGLYYRAVFCGKRCENIKYGDLFFRNRQAELKELERSGLGPDEQLCKVMSWLEELSTLELSVRGFEWSLLQEGYGQVAELFGKLGKHEDKLYCECRAYECGHGLMSYYDESERVAVKAMHTQIELGRRLTKVYMEKEDFDKAFYYVDANMDFLISAKGIVSADKIDALFKLVLEDREETAKR